MPTKGKNTAAASRSATTTDQDAATSEPAASGTPAGPRYVAYDQTTGAVLGTYEVLDGETGRFREQSDDEVRRMFAGSLPKGRARGAALGVLALEAGSHNRGARGLGAARVDVKKKRLVPLPALRLDAPRTQLEGDGADQVELTVTAVDDAGAPDKGYAGDVQVTTSHGKLSAPGGRLKLRGGTARLTLTATAETIARVAVTARAVERDATTGSLTLEFL